MTVLGVTKLVTVLGDCTMYLVTVLHDCTWLLCVQIYVSLAFELHVHAPFVLGFSGK